MSADEAQRVQNLLRMKIVAVPDYSGMDCYREAMEVVLLAAERQFSWQLSQDCLRFARVCDKDKLPQKVLMAVSKQCGNSQSCVFNALNDRLTPVAREFHDAAEPEATLS